MRMTDHQNSSPITIRAARRADLPALVRLLADDDLGRERESISPTLSPAYEAAFTAIQRDPAHELVVVEDQGEVIGTLQLTVIPYLTYQGGMRALIEAVRVAAPYRSRGIGEQLIAWAVEHARQRGCHLVQLTTDKRRPAAHRFYDRLGFIASHEGMKLHLGAPDM